MNSAHALTAENLLRALPEVLRNDESMEALAASVAQVLAQRPEEIRQLSIYPRIDELPEDLLDILAYDFKVDWWDADYALEEKRQTLQDSWRVHRMLGTKAAVELAISAIFPEVRVSEWFEYGGDPYHFRLSIDVSEEDTGSDRYQRVLERVNFYKNLRSHLDEIVYIIRAEGVATGYAAAAFTGGYMRITVPVRIDGEVQPPRSHLPMYAGVEVSETYYAVIGISNEANIVVNVSTGVTASVTYVNEAVESSISEHSADKNAHQDIRDLASSAKSTAEAAASAASVAKEEADSAIAAVSAFSNGFVVIGGSKPEKGPVLWFDDGSGQTDQGE